MSLLASYLYIGRSKISLLDVRPDNLFKPLNLLFKEQGSSFLADKTYLNVRQTTHSSLVLIYRAWNFMP
jgi:hypothetical protein